MMSCAMAGCGFLDLTEIREVLAVASFSLGACIASFLNVVIWRIPRGESIVSPPSHCPACGAAIRWYQNIPILSWLALRGRCANCRGPISSRYILVELLGAVLFLSAFMKMGLYVPLWLSCFRLLCAWIWLSLMIAGSMIDFDHKLLPDFVTIGGMILGIVQAVVMTSVNFAYGGDLSPRVGLHPLLWSTGGLVFGFGLLWLVRFFGSKAFHREAMGMGDVLLMGAVGALFGPIAVLFVLIVSSFLGSVVGFSMIALSRARLGRFVEIPYGPYICSACLLWMFSGETIIRWYLHFLIAA